MHSNQRTQESYDKLHHALEWPMLALSIIFTALLLAPSVFDLNETQQRAAESTMWFIWAAFVFEYLALLYVAPDRLQMVRTHLLDLAIILLPALRPLRILRMLRLLTVVGRATVAVRRIFRRTGFQAFLLVAGALVASGAGFVYFAEKSHPENAFEHFGDALWWAIVTSTTVGYGDYSPVTAAGRAVAVVLMLVGIALFSVVTANIAAFFVESDANQDSEERLSEISNRLARIERALNVDEHVNMTNATSSAPAPNGIDVSNTPSTTV